jgi:DNA-binding NtrC family response regulator
VKPGIFQKNSAGGQEQMNVLVVGDGADHRDQLLALVREWGHEVRAAGTVDEAMGLLSGFAPQALVTGMARAPGLMNALTRAVLPQQPPMDGIHGLYGRTPRMQEVFALIDKVAPTSAPVLLTGESGTGKELAARAIHCRSQRASGPFVAINCAAMPETLIESELFGHEKGSFTGAAERRAGAMEQAAGGTLFLDELGELPVAMQAKLLRAIEELRFRRVGGTQELTADVRIVAATNRHPMDAIRQGLLREDLYYRLNVFELALPPLRERREDIPLLVSVLILQLNEKHGLRVNGATRAFLNVLDGHAWEGNVRELRNVMERAAILARAGTLDVEHLPPGLSGMPVLVEEAAPTPRNFRDPEQVTVRVGARLEDAERALMEATLRYTRNNKTRAAAMLGISPRTLHTRLREYEVRPGARAMRA